MLVNFSNSKQTFSYQKIGRKETNNMKYHRNIEKLNTSHMN